jgi:hypothetical protein
MDSPFKVKIAEALTELNGPLKPSLYFMEKKYGVPHNILKRRLKDGVLKRIAR